VLAWQQGVHFPLSAVQPLKYVATYSRSGQALMHTHITRKHKGLTYDEGGIILVSQQQQSLCIVPADLNPCSSGSSNTSSNGVAGRTKAVPPAKQHPQDIYSQHRRVVQVLAVLTCTLTQTLVQLTSPFFLLLVSHCCGKSSLPKVRRGQVSDAQ
jgi:hypothetical protein